jgi:N-acetylmuramoyl-L-alanine amidase
MGKRVSVRAGHVLSTAGKQAPTGTKERELNEKVKEDVIKLLQNNGIATLDVSSPLNGKENRTIDYKKSNEFKADIHLELHHNAMSTNSKWQVSASGVETFYHPASSEGKKLATIIQNELVLATKMRNRGIKTNNIWTMLTKTTAVAVLPEMGFMDNYMDYSKITTEGHSYVCAKAIVKGVCKYFGMSFSEKMYGEEATSVDLITKDVQTKVLTFQRNHGLSPDGIIGPKTWAALMLYKTKYNAIIEGLTELEEKLKKIKEEN